MAGPYAHITLLHELMNVLYAGETHQEPVEAEVASAVRDHFPFCVLGAVSPDIPNLSQDETGGMWSDAMHYSSSGEMIVRGVRHVSQAPDEMRPKLLAWLLGYCAHVVTDVTIHPIVRIMVGDYAENRRRHRVCEMNQDAHIFARMNLGELRDSDRFTRHILACHHPGEPGCLDRDLVNLWDRLFSETHPRQYAHSHPPIQKWFAAFRDLADTRSGRSANLFPLASLIATGIQRDYPLKEHVDHAYIHKLTTPGGALMPYDDIFNKAVIHVSELWDVVGRGVLAGERGYLFRFGNWDLDTGLDERNRLVFWGC